MIEFVVYVIGAEQTPANEVFRYTAEVAVEWDGMGFDTHDHVGTPIIDAEAEPSAKFGGRRILTKLEFRSLFLPETLKWIDRFEAQFETYAYLTDEQKDEIRTTFKNFRESTEVNLDDPRWIPGLGLYVALGGMDAEEVTEVLRG